MRRLSYQQATGAAAVDHLENCQGLPALLASSSLTRDKRHKNNGSNDNTNVLQN
jgi:hypothetical protein